MSKTVYTNGFFLVFDRIGMQNSLLCVRGSGQQGLTFHVPWSSSSAPGTEIDEATVALHRRHDTGHVTSRM
eukprot:1851657-Amphidinium_carterae.1